MDLKKKKKKKNRSVSLLNSCIVIDMYFIIKLHNIGHMIPWQTDGAFSSDLSCTRMLLQRI